MSNKDNLLNAGKKRALPPKTRNIPEATELPLSEEETTTKMVVEPKINEKKEKVEKKPAKQPKVVEEPKKEETIIRGQGRPKKRKDGDKKISFWLEEDLVRGIFDNLGYGDSAGEVINNAIREYQQKHKTYKPN